jgi:hypothetical protein
MHWQYWPLSVTVPAGTAAASPATTKWPIVQGHLKQVRVEIPTGHNGRTGIRLVYQGTEIVPWSLNAWLIGNGQTFTIPWADEIMATGLSAQAYNTDSTSHTFYLYAEVWPTVAAAAAEAVAGKAAHPAAHPAHGKVKAIRRVVGAGT